MPFILGASAALVSSCMIGHHVTEGELPLKKKDDPLAEEYKKQIIEQN